MMVKPHHPAERARALLWELADACEAQMRNSPHLVPALDGERHGYLMQAVNLSAADAEAISRVNADAPRHLAQLQCRGLWR